MAEIIDKVISAYQSAKETMQDVVKEYFSDEYEATGMGSLSISKLNRLLKEEPFSTLLPYECYDYENDIYHNKDTLSIALEVIPLSGVDLDAFEAFINLINEKMPDDSILHFLMFSTNEISSQLERFENHRSKRGEIYANLAKKRTEHIRNLNDKSILKTEKYIFKNFKLYIDITIDAKLGDREMLLVRNAITGVLDGVGAKYRNLDPVALSALVRKIINQRADPKDTLSEISKYDPIGVQCHEPGFSLKVAQSSLYVNEGEAIIRCLNIKEYPPHWNPIGMGDMIGDQFKAALRLGFPFAMSCCVHIPKQDLLVAKYTTKRTNTLNGAKGIGKYSRKAVDTAKDLDFMMKLNEEGQRLVKIAFDYAVFGDTETIDTNMSSLKSFLDAKKWRYSESKYTQLHGLLRCLPMTLTPDSLKSMDRFSTFKTVPAQTAINLLPMQAEPIGCDSPAMMLGGRRGQLSFWDPFSNPQGNYNVVVAASSGAGKSVFNQEYILSHISSGGRAWIIDVGRSYYKLTKLLGGEFIEFNSSSKISLNPFSEIDDIYDKEAGYMDLLKPLVAQMASPYQQLSQVQMSEIEQAILGVWDQLGSDMTISDVAKQLLSVNDSRANDLGKMLFPYTAKGMYGHYFEGRSTFRFDSPLVCLELEELKTKEDLKSVVLMILMFQMTQSMYLGDRKTKTTMLIDEAWDMLKNIQGSSFIEAGCRRARKYNGNFVICTQSINDCFDNKASLEAYNNSDWTVILRHRDTALKGVIGSNRLDISEAAFKLAKSLESKAGDFSEALIKGPGGSFLGRLILDPFSIELFSTKGDDFVKINSLLDSGATIEEALNKMVLEKME